MAYPKKYNYPYILKTVILHLDCSKKLFVYVIHRQCDVIILSYCLFIPVGPYSLNSMVSQYSKSL